MKRGSNTAWVPPDYSLVARGRVNLFSFCMCAGGQVIPSVSEPGYFSSNGMSLSRRSSPFANSGMMVTLEPRDFGSTHPLAGIELQRRYEHPRAFELGREEYACPIQRASDFLAGRTGSGTPASSYPRKLVTVNVAELVPAVALGALQSGLPQLDQRWRGRFLAEATLVGPEARGSSPVRFPRHEDSTESIGLAGLYPIGEGSRLRRRHYQRGNRRTARRQRHHRTLRAARNTIDRSNVRYSARGLVSPCSGAQS